MPREVGELVNNVGQRLTADLIQSREQNRLSQLASPVSFPGSAAIPRGQPTRTPRLDGSLVKGHIYFIPLIPVGLRRKKKTSRATLTALKQLQHALLSFARQYKLLVPPYFCCSKRGTLYDTSLETLAPKVYSNWARQRAGSRGKKHKEK